MDHQSTTKLLRYQQGRPETTGYGGAAGYICQLLLRIPQDPTQNIRMWNLANPADHPPDMGHEMEDENKIRETTENRRSRRNKKKKKERRVYLIFMYLEIKGKG